MWPEWQRSRLSFPMTTKSPRFTPRRSWISAPGITGNQADANLTRRAGRLCQHWSVCWPATRIIPVQFTSISMPSRPRTGPSAPNPMPTDCAVRSPVPATSCTCRATSTIGSAALARVAQANGDNRTAIVRFERAAALQDALPYTEPPYWYYPIRQSLAAALLQAGRYAEAERQFQRALSRAPSNGWSYYGLAELYKARGNIVAARKAEADLAKTWIGDRGLLQISNL